jgi:hypothetical protein
MRKYRVLASVLAVAVVFPLLARPAASRPAAQANQQGQGLIIELDNEFIKQFANRATITSEYVISGMSAVHPPDKDGEVHVGGWADAAGLACVAEVMNAATSGKVARQAFTKALNAHQKVTVTGAWRLWGEHGGTAPQVQSLGTTPKFPLPGEFPSNPDHVFEIHPVTTIKSGNQVTDAAAAIGETPGFTPHDATKAIVLGYETLPCKLVPKNGRTRIITRSLGFNFTEFVIRLSEDPVPLEDGHGVICSVFDTDGELLVRGRRMVFVKGTDADDQLQGLKKDRRMRVTGIPRISLKLVQWRLEHQDDPGFDVKPLEWRLPYEMIIVAATPLGGDGD